MDEVNGTSGNDTIKGTLSGTSNADGSFKAVDVIDGGAGVDTLQIVDATGNLALPSLLNVSNVEVLSMRSAGALVADASTVAFTTVNATQSTDATVTANAATNVVVTGATGDISVQGGKDVSITSGTATKNVTVGSTTDTAGAVTVANTKVTTGLVKVVSGTDVNVTASGVTLAGSNNFESSGGSANVKAAVIVGASVFDAASSVTGNANVTSKGAAITATSSNATLGAIAVGAKGNVTVVQSATENGAAALTDTSSVSTVTQGAVFVSTGATGTSVSVTQDAAASANDAVKAVEAKATTQKLTFTAAASGDVIVLAFDNATYGSASDKLTFTTAKALTAAEVAAAFANLAKNAIVGSAPATNGSYSNAGTIDTGWTSGEVTTNVAGTEAYVTFSNASASAVSLSKDTTGTATVAVGTLAAGTDAVLAETGRLGVVAGAVNIDGEITGDDVLTTVTLNSYGTSTVKSDALTTLNLSNSAGGLTATTASTGSITANLNKVTGSISVDGGSATITGLTINASGTKSASAVTAAVAKTVTINADVDLDLTSSVFSAATKMVVTGAGKVTLDGDHSTSVLAAVDASAATGTVDASGVALTAAGVYTGGSGADTFTVTASATKASTGGAGNDVITVSSFGTGGSVDAGEGVDTLVMTEADAATADANTTFSTKATNFERITISTANTAASTLDMANLGQTNYVTTSGTGGVVYAGAGTVYAGTTTDKITFVYNGVTYTTAAFASTDNDATELNALIDAAVIVGTTTALGAGKVTATLTNSGADITLIADNGSASLTAGIYDASTDIAGVNQVLTLDKLTSGATVVLTKGGSITAQVTDAATGTADSITVAMSQDGSLDAGTFTAANVETINISADDKVVDVTGAKDEFGANIADGKDDTNSVQTLLVVADKATVVNVTGSADLTLDTTSSTLVTVDASALTGKFVYTADGKSTGSTVTGGSGDDTLVASGNGDVLIGGAGNDKLTAANLSTLTGGAGNDTFAFAAVDATLYSTITDLSAGDVIDLATGSGFTSTKVSLAGAATFAQYLDAAIVAAAAGATTKGAAWFQFGGDTFLVAEADTSSGNTYGSGDAVIAITGLVDLSKAVFNATTGDLTIV